MSRIGNAPIIIPAGVEVRKDRNTVVVKGPKGELSRSFHPDINITIEGEKILVKRPTDERNHRAIHGLSRTLLANMVKGVTEGFEKTLEIQGVGYRAVKKGEDVELMLGYSHPVRIPKEEGIQIEIPAPTKIVVRGIDRERVGEIAARLRAIRKPEPYKGKGIRYQGEYVRRKAGKTAK
jgi:large subunit ribosomal protein L6